MNVFVDSSIRIKYFRGSGDYARRDFLIEENLIELYSRDQHFLLIAPHVALFLH